MEIITCAEYNARQEAKHHEAKAKWSPNKSGFPSIAMYFFYDLDQERRTDGYVLIKGGSHRWFQTKEEAKQTIT